MAHNANYVEVLNRLRTVRKVKGWTLREVEEYSHGDVCAIVLGSWERGTRKPTLERLMFLCEDIYRIPLSAILSNNDEDFRKALANEIMKSDKFANTFSPLIHKRGEK
jgi:transcriptional regulator with XRE-family HTH domain